MSALYLVFYVLSIVDPRDPLTWSLPISVQPILFVVPVVVALTWENKLIRLLGAAGQAVWKRPSGILPGFKPRSFRPALFFSVDGYTQNVPVFFTICGAPECVVETKLWWFAATLIVNAKCAQAIFPASIWLPSILSSPICIFSLIFLWKSKGMSSSMMPFVSG